MSIDARDALMCASPPAIPPTTAAAPSAAYLQCRLGVIEARVRAAVAMRRADDTNPDDPFRGLYLTDAHVDVLLAGRLPLPLPDAEATDAYQQIEAWADHAETSQMSLRLRELRRAFELDAIDVELLLIALAPDLDPRFEKLYGYLHDDVSRRRASVGLALELCGPGFQQSVERSRFDVEGRLLRGGLLLVEDLTHPFLTRSLRVPDRVIAFVLGDDAIDDTLDDLTTDHVSIEIDATNTIRRVIERGARLLYLRERVGSAGIACGATALQQAGRAPLVLDLTRLSSSADVQATLTNAVREARLRRGGLVVGPIDVLADRRDGTIRVIAESPTPVIITGTQGWDPAWTPTPPLTMDAPIPSPEERAHIWRRTITIDDAQARAVAHLRLAPEQITRAAMAAEAHARANGRDVEVTDLHHGARAQNSAGLERLARRVTPRSDWTDLVLPNDALMQLHELAARARHRDRVLDDWGMGSRTSRGRGITALFAGESGTGKTLSAEVIAGALGLDLYVIDLSTVVDKYVGETEKNLEKIFVEADRVNGVLLFDEADAIFGKRSDVKDAHDRYANVETAYLLQRMERFDGLAVLTTNLRSNVDEAFTRRIDAIIDFPIPEEPDRLALWHLNLGRGAPRASDLDVAFMARSFKIAGGNIRNIVLTAAYLAASDDGPIEMAHLVRATEREYRKMGRLCVAEEFGPYFHLVQERW